jgi:hypothetical protein
MKYLALVIATTLCMSCAAAAKDRAIHKTAIGSSHIVRVDPRRLAQDSYASVDAPHASVSPWSGRFPNGNDDPVAVKNPFGPFSPPGLGG